LQVAPSWTSRACMTASRSSSASPCGAPSQLPASGFGRGVRISARRWLLPRVFDRIVGLDDRSLRRSGGSAKLTARRCRSSPNGG
jgi:hypothetical protein